MSQSFSRKSDILCISTIDWDFIWQGHQEIMSTLAAEGHRVLFVENTGIRAPNVRDLPRIRQRVRNWWRGTKGFRQERPNLFVFSPLLLPLPYSVVARWINRFVILRALKRWMRATGFYRPILWTFLPTPLALDLIRAVEPQLTIYYCIDDLPSSSPGARRLVPSEERLFKEADLVFVTSEKLRQRAARISSRVHLFPFGVSFERFELVRNGHEEAPADLSSIKHPIVGYMGGLHQWVDQDLLADVATRMPDVNFVLVGPAQTDVSRLEQCPNVHLMGQRPHPDVPKYVKAFDVGVVPYRIAEYTANVYPTKLNEYLVMGIPVVATDLPEIRRFNVEHGEVLSVASDAEAFAGAIRAALGGANAGAAAKRIAAAEANSWKSRIDQMNDVIAEALETKSASEQGWDAALRRVYRGARSHAARVIIAIAAVYLLVFQTNLLWWAAEPLKIVDAPSQSDAIVVFAGGVGESGRAGGGQQERLKTAIDLYKAGHAPVMILSSGFVYSFHEAELMRALAIDQGIPASQIILEEHATNTYENVKFVDAILRDHKWQRVLLVSSPYHMRRALLVWRKVAPEVTVIATPPERTQFYDHTSGATLEQVRGILQEYLAIGAYWRRGWL
jgi:uncharacterized SAM-binding protein YcdF (DUF218 family)/glycosyltransferase involved in cell wall biosynthesis